MDAYDKLLFLSLWGRDTAIQEFLAGISLANEEGGINSFFLTTGRRDGGEPLRKLIQIGESKRLNHHSGRMPASNVFGGDMAHLWVFDRLVTDPDLANRRTIAISRAVDTTSASSVSQSRIWQLTKAICHLPLLDHWAETIVKRFYEREWIKDFNGIGVNGALIDLSLSEEVEDEISTLIRDGVLCLN
ncbi:MAG: hypothetical protein JAY64_00125 [Candidatus Thiodiazotropha weberae]|nr:hypothetical protein [Candidatus Thiodiazotropha lotti]MCW4209557.1 hypothetical protein [Candidatus Thiodiazotropha lotti]